MTIVERLQASVHDATGLVLHYQSAEQLNRIADVTDYPCAFLFLLGNQQLNTDGANIRERLQIAVFFCDLSEFDFAAAENEAIIEGCKSNALKWLRALYSSREFRLVSVNGTERAYDMFDAQLTGFAINVTVEELIGDYSCRDPQPVEGVLGTLDGDNWEYIEITRNGRLWARLGAE